MSMPIVPVVTGFLCSSGRLLLMKRSARVSTHQGCWAGISGHVEDSDQQHPDPILYRMLTEIREETSLIHPRDFQLVQRAKEPLLIQDDKNKRIWKVHAFRFELVPGCADSIQLDWENSECKWIDVQEMLEKVDPKTCVPKLHETLQSVL